MPQQKRIIAIRLQHSPIMWMATEQNNSKCFDAGVSNLYPDTRPWYVQTQT